MVAAVRLLLASLLLWYLFCLFVPPGDGSVVSDVSFPPGSGIRRLAAELKGKGVIRSSWHFFILTRLRGDAHRLKAGEYRFTDGMAPDKILGKIVAGDVDFRKFALPEGYSIYQVAELLGQKGYVDKEKFLKKCRDKALLLRLAIGADSVEGYLYPATYNIVRNVSEEQLIEQMVSQFRKVSGEWATGNGGGGLSRQEVVTLASLIEKEAVTPAERPLIASVFLNRLKVGMPLQSDPTAVYGMRAFGGKVTKADVVRKSPYNTYVIKGLPPGPIGNPGIDAIRAVLNPAKSDYYYFVARQDGTHYFSLTLDEHNRAVRNYLKN